MSAVGISQQYVSANHSVLVLHDTSWTITSGTWCRRLSKLVRIGCCRHIRDNPRQALEITLSIYCDFTSIRKQGQNIKQLVFQLTVAIMHV